MKKKEYVTKEKYEELKQELESLKTEKRQEVAEHLEYARSLGDLAENAEYHDARAKQAEVEARISQLDELLKNAEIISYKKSDKVEVGSVVVVKKRNTDDESTYEIVGSEEADANSNKISFASPLGSNLLGKKKGEEITLVTPKGKTHYVIVSIK